MKSVKIKVEFNYECPFHYEEIFKYSEYTSGVDSKCTLLKKDCCGLGQKKCPLKDNGIIVKLKG